jgi:hypothetical protein
VTGKIAYRAGAKLPPGAPANGCVVGVIWTGWNRFEPALPIEAGGYRGSFFRPVGEFCPAVGSCMGPGVNIVDVTDGAVPDPLAGQTNILAGMSEITELCGDAGLAGGFGDYASFVDGSTEWFFTINVFAFSDSGKADYGMRMVRCGDKDGVDVFFVKHFIIVMVSRTGLAVLCFDEIKGWFQTGFSSVVR